MLQFGAGTALIDETAAPEAQLTPFYRSLVGGYFLLLLLAGWAYGKGVGNIKTHRDLVKMMSDSMADMAYFLVLAFMVAHFVAMFSWSNLGLITAVHGAETLKSMNLPAPILLGAGLVLVMVWVGLEIPLGQSAPVFAPPPTG